jgi:hypothetical protein
LVLLIRVYARDSGQSNNGSTKKEIESNSQIKKFQVNEFEEGANCVICLSEYEKNEKIRILNNCSHSFHKSCIDKWLKSKGKCPLCVQPILKEEEEEKDDKTSENDNLINNNNIDIFEN